MQLSSRNIALTGSITYLILSCFAIVFYKERVLNFDMAFHMFRLLLEGDFHIVLNRFGAGITQLLPLAAIHLGLPLKVVMILYSLNFVLYHFAAFLIALFYFRNKSLALMILLFSTLIVTISFYTMQSELVQGCVLMFLFYGFLLEKKNTADFTLWNWLFFLMIITALVFFHPLMPFPFLFMGIYFYLDNTKVTPRSLIIAIVVFFSIFFAKPFLITMSGYEKARFDSMQNFSTYFPDYFFIDINYLFLKRCIREYYYFPILLTACILFYRKSKQYKKLLLMLSFFGGYLFLINVTNAHWPEQFYVEGFYWCMSLFVIVPFVMDVFPQIMNTRLAYALLIGTLLIRLIHIGFTSQRYRERLAWHETVLDSTKNSAERKIILAEKYAPMNKLIMSWSSSYEFLLLSSLEGPQYARGIMVDDNPARFNYILNQNKTLFTKWEFFPYTDLRKEYFNFQDTSRYIIKE